MISRLPPNSGAYAPVDPDTGQVFQPPSYWSLPRPIDETDPWDEVEVSAGGHVVHFSRRSGGVSRWQMSTPGGPTLKHAVNRRDMGGRSLSFEETLQEDINAVVATTRHGPTQGGSARSFQSCNINMVPPPIPTHLLAQQQGTSVVTEGCTIPFQFDSWGVNNAVSDLGGDRRTPALWWRQRMFQRLETTWRGRAGVHELIAAAFWPYRQRSQDVLDEHSTVANIFLTNAFAAAGTGGVSGFYLPRTRTFTSYATEINAATGTSTTQRVSASSRETLLNGGTSRSDPVVFQPGDLVVGMFATDDFGGTGEPLAVGLMGTVGSFEDTKGQVLANRLLIQNVPAGSGTGADDAPHQYLGLQAQSSNLRRAGWVMSRGWVLTGDDLASLQALADAALADGYWREPLPWHKLPEHLFEDTDRPPERS